VALATAGSLLGCAGRIPGVPQLRVARYTYFEAPDRDDPWSPKITGWQSRERGLRETSGLTPIAASVAGSGAGSAAPVADSEALRAKYLRFRAETRRSQARELALWVQAQAREHYRPDGPLDHWATLEETLDANGDDCDGLELLTYYLLRDLGFARDEVFRAIVHRPSDGQHHMVTLWFEDRDDPWVIDPTGAMTQGMPHMSELKDWVPLKVFAPDEEYSVRAGSTASPPSRSD
jgi:hypothetical protein